jgi:DNA polymerase III subunit gamma/tau
MSSWYRVYRPQRVADLEIAPVREHFLQVLSSGDYAHAYLFAGPRGTGKTSTARILARVLNDPANAEAVLAKRGPLNEPSSDDPFLQRISQGRSQGVIEQDAASHRGIDDIRQLQEEVSVVTTEGTIRVVILDEVHMLTADAFNALLKLLEEPPERVVFILATTELHKVPATIQSRCQVIQFRLATRPELEHVLQRVIDAESLKIEPDALEGLVTAANGSFRDAVKWLQQASASGVVSAEAVSRLVGSTQSVQALLVALAKKDVAALQTTFTQLRQAGTSFASVEVAVLQALHERLSRALGRSEPQATVQAILGLLEFLVMRLNGGVESVDGLKFEVACYRWALGENSGSGEMPVLNDALAKPAPKAAKVAVQASEVEPIAELTQPVPVEAKAPLTENGTLTQQQVQLAWEPILLSLRTRSTAVEALLRTSQLGNVDGNKIEVRVARAFHQDRLNEPKYRLLLEEVMSQRLGTNVKLDVTLLPQNPDEFTPVDNTPDDFAAVVEGILSKAQL